jgi:hypothetical protein
VEACGGSAAWPWSCCGLVVGARASEGRWWRLGLARHVLWRRAVAGGRPGAGVAAGGLAGDWSWQQRIKVRMGQGAAGLGLERGGGSVWAVAALCAACCLRACGGGAQRPCARGGSDGERGERRWWPGARAWWLGPGMCCGSGWRWWPAAKRVRG